jgi:murein DD-endopeptidase MepM/ murein hydrolase activator NlpD
MSGIGVRSSWPRWVRLPRLAGAVLGAAFALLAVCGSQGAAFATGAWARPVPGRVLVAYGEVCPGVGGSGTRTHSGIDLECAEGETATACEGGTVSFAGPVPGDAGGRVIAVTVSGDDGLRVTYMPLATAAVAAGGRVEAGSRIGGVAGSGDASCGTPHLHVSVRRGKTYLDPTGMLAGTSGEVSGGGSGAGADAGNAAAADLPAAPDAVADTPGQVGSTDAGVSVAAAGAAQIPDVTQAGAPATLAALRAGAAVSPAAAMRAVTGRVSLLAPMPVRASLPVPMPHATGLAAIAGSLASLERSLMLACTALLVALAVLGCAWRSVWRAAEGAAAIGGSGALAPAAATTSRRA